MGRQNKVIPLLPNPGANRLHVPLFPIVATKGDLGKDNGAWWGDVKLLRTNDEGYWVCETVPGTVRKPQEGIYELECQCGEDLKENDVVKLYGDDWVRDGQLPRPWKWISDVEETAYNLECTRKEGSEKYSNFLWGLVSLKAVSVEEAQQKMRSVFDQDLYPTPERFAHKQ